MPMVDDVQVVGGATDKTKQELQQALLDLLKGNPEILNSVTQSTTKQDGHATAEAPTRSGDEDGRTTQESPSMSFPEDENRLNQQRRASYQWQSDSDDGIDTAWTTATKNMSPRELFKWRRSLFSVYAGHLPSDITKKELVQLFNEVGNVQDVHLQPASKDGSHTYGFIRFLTLEECSDAVSMLHGRFLGNRTITVEYACETKERLQGSDPSDLPLDKKDKLLRNDFPKADHLYRPMSDAESQEKMILWKLRCSATRQKSNGQESKEELMSRIQEIVKKVASLPEETRALPSGSEGSPCSPWILKEINGNYISLDMAQPHPVQFTCKHEEQRTVLNNSERQVTGAPPKVAVKHSPNMVSTSDKKDHVQTQMLTENHEPTLGVSAVMFSYPPNTQRAVHGLFEEAVSSEVPHSPGRDDSSPNGMEATASDSASLGSLPSPERPMRQHCQFCHSLSPTLGHASESSHSESTSSSSSFASLASPCTFCHKREEILSMQDDCPPLPEQGQPMARQGQPLAEQGLPPSGNHSIDMGLCSFESGNNYVTKNSDLYEGGQKQKQFSPEIHQPKQASMPSQCSNQEQMHVVNQSNRMRSFAQQGLQHDSKNTDLLKKDHQQAQYSSKIPEPKQASVPIQYADQEQMYVTNHSNRSFAHHGHLSDPHTMNASFLKEGQKQMQYSSKIPQPTQASMPNQYTNQEQTYVTNQPNRSFAHHGHPGDRPHTTNTGFYKEGQKQMQYSSQIPQPTQGSMPSQYSNQEQTHFSNRSNRPFAHQRILSGQPNAMNTGLLKEEQKQMQYSSENPQPAHVSMLSQYTNQEQMCGTNPSNRPFARHGKFSSTPHAVNTGLPKEDQKHLSEIPKPKQVPLPRLFTNQEQMNNANQANKPFSQQGLMSPPTHTKTTDLLIEGQKQTKYSPEPLQPKQVSMPCLLSDPPRREKTDLNNKGCDQHSAEILQPKQAFVPSQYTYQEQIHAANQSKRPFVHHGHLSESPHTKDTDLCKENQAQAQYSSEIPKAKPASVPTQYSNKESMSVHVANQGNRPQQGLPSDPPISEKSDLLKEGQKKMQSSSEVPQAKQTSVSRPHSNQEQIQANRPFPQQSLLNDPVFANFLGQPPHIQAMLANTIASGWQQPGFPRHPFLAPGAMNPGMFQGWNRNLLLQQQLLAARMPFGAPFRAGGHQSRAGVGFGVRGPVPHQVRGNRMPFGRTNVGPMGSGRSFAPRFYNPGAENVKMHGESEKSVPGVSRNVGSEISLPIDKNIVEACNDKVQHISLTANDSLKSSARPPTNPTSTSTTVSSDRHLPVDKNSLEACDNKVQHSSLAANDSLKSSARPPTNPSSPENTKVESANKESSTPGSNLARQEGDLESPRTNKTSPSKMSRSEELKRIKKENESLRQRIDWGSSGRTANDDPRVKREALRADIHNKEVQLQKEKEIVMARKAEQELLYERAKLEAAFDQQLKKELEAEKKLGETKNKIYLARLENELLRAYQDLHGTITEEKC